MLLSFKFMGPLNLIKRAPNESMDLGLRTSVMEERHVRYRGKENRFFFFLLNQLVKESDTSSGRSSGALLRLLQVDGVITHVAALASEA